MKVLLYYSVLDPNPKSLFRIGISKKVRIRIPVHRTDLDSNTVVVYFFLKSQIKHLKEKKPTVFFSIG
jgi:hypothetical protein